MLQAFVNSHPTAFYASAIYFHGTIEETISQIIADNHFDACSDLVALSQKAEDMTPGLYPLTTYEIPCTLFIWKSRTTFRNTGLICSNTDLESMTNAAISFSTRNDV